MLVSIPPQLTNDEIDDLFYSTRVNEAQELRQSLRDLSQKYQCQQREVLEACIDPHTGNSVLHYCAANGFADLLPALLTYLASATKDTANGSIKRPPQVINNANAEGNTPLHWAALNGHLAVVQLLVAAGADLWVKNKAGHLAVFEAERAEKSDVVQYLLEAGGTEVEKGGIEGQASVDDVADIQAASVGASNGHAGRSNSKTDASSDAEMIA